MTRRLARELALQTLFSIEVGHQEPADALAATLKRRPSAGAETPHDESSVSTPQACLFIKDLVLGTLEHAEASDAVIEPLLEGWTIERLPTIDRIVLRMSVYELMHCGDVPPPVVINEAIELVKKFSTADSSRFVNGVLATASRQLV